MTIKANRIGTLTLKVLDYRVVNFVVKDLAADFSLLIREDTCVHEHVVRDLFALFDLASPGGI